MFKYFVVSWNPADASQTQAAQLIDQRLARLEGIWQNEFRADGLRVMCAGVRPGSSEVYRLSNRGVVLGKIFSGTSEGGFVDARSTLAEPARSHAILRTAGRALVESYWGRYVAIASDDDHRRRWILRAPAGDLPCFMTTFRGVRLCFSFMEDCVALRLIPFTINWTYLASHLVASVATKATGLNEVEELLPGECLRLEGNNCYCTPYWNPIEIARAHSIDSMQLAAPRVREMTRACVHSWASAYDSIIHHLSGGLDSSIVLACLHDAPSKPRLTCVNQYSQGAASDERHFARCVAARFGVELVEQERIARVDLADTLQATRFPKPAEAVRRAENSRAEAQFARARDAGAIFHGGGGDELFHRHHPWLAATDFVYLNGIRPRLLRLALEGALAARISFWSVLVTALRDGLRRGYWDVVADVYQHRTLMNEELLETVKRERWCCPPWCESTAHVPPGKLWHINAICKSGGFYDPLGRNDDPEFVSPLLSQPLVDLLLRIPTHVLKEGAWDRAVARRAFAADLPAEIVNRRSKGGIVEHGGAIMRSNLPFLRSMLLEGQLVREGMLDRARVTEALADRPSQAWTGTSDVFRVLSVELWLRAWSDYSVDASGGKLAGAAAGA